MRRVVRRMLLGGLAVLMLCGISQRADAAEDADTQLVSRYAPVVRLVQQTEPCGRGEPFIPTDVNAVLANDTVALRGPWDRDDLIKIAPTAQDLAQGLPGYHLDFPGNPLEPGCSYEKWARIVTTGTKPTVYAHVIPSATGDHRLALQYWFYYPFNDYNNKHESDWELIQLEFDASTSAEALLQMPIEAGYSQHEGAELAEWDADKLEIVDDTHPVVYPAAGSHANYYEPALFLGRTGSQGVGCDDTRGPSDELHPEVAVIPSDPVTAMQQYPWLGYQGRWGQREEAFYNGPTGPSQKSQWTSPESWMENKGRDSSYAVPVGGLLGTRTTDFFCGAVGTGSDAVRGLLNDPVPLLAVFALVLVLIFYGLSATRWRPTAYLRVRRRRALGQAFTAAGLAYLSRPLLFIGIGLFIVPLALAAGGVHLLFADPSITGREGQRDAVQSVWLAMGTLLALAFTALGVLFVQAATTRALADIDAGRDVSIWSAYRHALRRWRPLVGALALAAAIATLLAITVAGTPVAVALVVLWSLFIPAIEVGGESAVGALRRSVSLVRKQTLKVALAFVAIIVVGAIAGPVAGTLVILGSDIPIPVVELITGLTYALLSPFAALLVAYVYYDAVVRERLEATGADPDVLPEEG